MIKSDDSSLTPEEYAAVRKAAVSLLDRGGAWNVHPTPVPHLMAAAQLKTAPVSAFDPRAIERYARQAGEAASRFLKSAIEKVLGIFDVQADVVHIDESVNKEKQAFLSLHEAGHKEIPHQRGMFKWIQDCTATLSPDVADLFDREANNFATIVLFQDDGFGKMAADSAFGIKVPLSLQRKFGSSVYATMRQYVRTHEKACAVIVLDPPQASDGNGFTANVRRIVHSPEFIRRFGSLHLPEAITTDSALARFIPTGSRRMSRPYALALADRNGDKHEFVAEGFKTGYNVFLLLHVRATLKTSIIMPNSA